MKWNSGYDECVAPITPLLHMNIIDRVPSEAKLRSVFLHHTFGARPSCPRCGTSHVQRSENRYRCARCRHHFSITSVSWLKYTKLPYKKIWMLLDCWQRRIAFATSAEIAGVSTVTVRAWFEKFECHLVYESPQLSGIVEVDEAFFGRRRYRNQRIALGAYEREHERIVLRPAWNREQETTDRFLLTYVHPTSTVCTDGAVGYEGIDAFFGYEHIACNHSTYDFGPTNHIEAVWSALKRFIRRTYHHVWKERLPSLLREFEARWNTPELFASPLNYLETCLYPVPSR